MASVEIPGGRLVYDLAGASGDPVVLIHGGWEDGRGFDRVVPGLSAALQVLVYDRRGHGSSRGPPRKGPVEDDAADLARLLEASGLFPAHLVGHAYGGAVALRLAVDRPELVRSVAFHEIPWVGLLEPAAPPPPDPTSWSASLGRLRELASRAPEAAAREYLEMFGAPFERWSSLDAASQRVLVDYAGVWAEEMADPGASRPALAELRGVALPVLATSGGASPPFASRIHDRLVAELPNGRALRLSEGGHRIHRTDPDLWVGVLGEFLLERNVPTT